jgi:Uma2 family endonuclease
MIQTPVPAELFSVIVPGEIKLQVTPEQFEMLALANRDLRLERTAKGVLIVNPPTGWETGNRNVKISYFLVRWIEEEGGSGLTFNSSTGFILPNGATRSPDACWVSQERWDALTTEQRAETFAPICPDFIVELRSASDNLQPLREKVLEYMANGTQLGWLINPICRQVEIYRPGKDTEILDNPVELSGEDIVSGFVLDLRRVWG